MVTLVLRAEPLMTRRKKKQNLSYVRGETGCCFKQPVSLMSSLSASLAHYIGGKISQNDQVTGF